MKIQHVRILTLLVMTAAATLLLLALRFGFDTEERFLNDGGAVSAYLSAIGALYGILGAFTIFVVWTQFNDTNTAVFDEAKNLRDLLEYAEFLGDSEGVAALHGAVEGSVDVVLGDEWVAMETGRGSVDAQRAFREIAHILRAIKLDGDRDESVWARMIEKLEDVSDLRAKRIDLSGTRIPQLLRLLLYSVSFALVAGFFMLAIANDFLAIVMTAATTAIVVLVIDAVQDMDNPFGGQWNISAVPFEELAAVVAAP
jgi:hypothetical protein